MFRLDLRHILITAMSENDQLPQSWKVRWLETICFNAMIHCGQMAIAPVYHAAYLHWAELTRIVHLFKSATTIFKLLGKSDHGKCRSILILLLDAVIDERSLQSFWQLPRPRNPSLPHSILRSTVLEVRIRMSSRLIDRRISCCWSVLH